MSVRTCMHFMTHTGGPLPTIALRPHPSSDTLHLTLVLAEQDFTWSDTAERMRELFTAILAEPLLRNLPLPERAALTRTARDYETEASAEGPCFCGRHILKIGWAGLTPDDNTWTHHTRRDCKFKDRPPNATDAEWAEVEAARASMLNVVDRPEKQSRPAAPTPEPAE